MEEESKGQETTNEESKKKETEDSAKEESGYCESAFVPPISVVSSIFTLQNLLNLRK